MYAHGGAGRCALSVPGFPHVHVKEQGGPRKEPHHQLYLSAIKIKFSSTQVVLTEIEHSVSSGRPHSQAQFTMPASSADVGWLMYGKP